MRRSPAEFYVRYRLLRSLETPVEEITVSLANEMVYVPGKEYMYRLRNEMGTPRIFRPDDLCDVTSQVFLRKHQVWSLFHPGQGAREALSAFHDMRSRTLLQHLVAGPHPDVVILDVFVKRTGRPLSQEGLQEFKHYFWNGTIVTPTEIAEYAKEYLRDSTVGAMTRIPMSPDGMTLSLSKLGVVQESVDSYQAYTDFKRYFHEEGIDIARTRPSGLQRSTALKMAIEGFHLADVELRKLATASGMIVDEIERFKAASRELPNVTLQQLTEGRTPLPVTALVTIPAEDDEDEGDVEEGMA